MQDKLVTIDRLTRRPPFRRQFRALFLKNLSLQWTYKKTNFLLIFLPVALSVIMAGFTLAQGFGDVYQSQVYAEEDASKQRYWFWAYYVNSTTYNNIGNLSSNGFVKEGFLGFIPQNPLSNSDDYFPPEYQYVPFFVEAPSSNWVDDTMYDALSDWVEKYGDNPDIPYSEIQNVALAAIEFQNLDPLTLRIEYVIQSDTADDFLEYNCWQIFYSGLEMRYFFTNYMHTSLINSYLNSTQQANVKLDFQYQAFGNYFESGAVSVMLVLYVVPFSFCMIQPFIAYLMVAERSTRFLEMMKIMGMKMRAYWAINLMYFSSVAFASFVLCYLVALPFFQGSNNWALETSPVVILLLFFLWAFCGTSFAVCWSQLFPKPMPAAISLLLLMMIDPLLCSFGLLSYESTARVIPLWCAFFPLHTFIYGFFLLMKFFYVTQEEHLVLNHWTSAFTSQMVYVYITMAVQIVVMLLLTEYLHNVMPNKGLSRPWYYLFQSPKKIPHFNTIIDTNPDIEETEPDDCKLERKRATNLKRPLPVRLVFLKKEYEHTYKDDSNSTTTVALESFCLAMDSGECIGLLGPNGAGKSTIMNILTGLTAPTSGFAVIHGFNILTNMEQIHQLVGFCPQFDVLWDELSIEEHLLFYTRLKGAVPKNLEYQETNRFMEQLNFSSFAKRPVSTLSGGEKRRLSVAIAFLGNPKLILLDEPTTSLDATSRHQIWELINQYKTGRSILLTTHNMQEADALCSRIGIMSRGKLLCIDQPARLKSRFGKGFKLIVTPTFGSESEVKEVLLNEFPSMHLEPESLRTFHFLIPPASKETNEEGIFLPEVIKLLVKLKKAGNVEDWKVKQCSLEDVFLNLIHEDEILE